MAWAFLGHRPSGRFVWSSLVAVAGIGLLFVHEFRQHSARADEIALGIGLTLIGMIGASAANVFQAREEIRRFPLFSMLAWSMVAGAVMDVAIAFAMTGPPVFDSRPGYWLGVVYLALPASVLTFSLYYPVVRKIGPGQGRIFERDHSRSSPWPSRPRWKDIAGHRSQSRARCWRLAE